MDHSEVCEMKLTSEEVKIFNNMVSNQYWYELFIDDLPMWGMVGEILRDNTHNTMEQHIFTHRSISLAYNNNRVVEANLTSENPVSIEENTVLKFTYSVVWKETEKSFDSRFDRYLEDEFFEHQIHW